ncbi:unnamed protein product [Cylindrotheca closterium]|uniref:Uncharacterized protein n=1 Tax=Cylindrotheca closterium TaxID=2856 RepID=A0AAD2G821_9STRA|nr:unnamed protein product [Cylindrotheca closterium]
MRIPFALQTVFLQSQAGEDVEQIVAPKDGTAHKAYPPKVPKARGSDVKKEPMKKIGYRPVTNRQTAMSLKIFNRLSKHVTTAADATKSRLWQKTSGDDDEDLWIPKTVAASSEPSSTTATAPKKKITNPQEYLDQELAARGYSVKRYPSLPTGYHCPPNPLQLASFGNHLNQAVRQKDPQLLRDLMKLGVSPNACNKFGESIVHSVCRRGEAEKLQILLDHNCSIQVSDDYGRTPLHDACWQTDDPDFDTVRILLAIDRDLMFLTDIRGSTALTYVKKENHPAWISFLQKEMDHYWPKGGMDNKQRVPPLTKEKPGSRQLPSQITNLGLDIISLLATGQLSATEPRLLLAVRPAGVMPTTVVEPQQQQQQPQQQPSIEKPSVEKPTDESEHTMAMDDDSYDSYDSDSDSDYDSDYDSDEDYDFDDGDLNEIIMIGNMRGQEVM